MMATKRIIPSRLSNTLNVVYATRPTGMPEISSANCDAVSLQLLLLFFLVHVIFNVIIVVNAILMQFC